MIKTNSNAPHQNFNLGPLTPDGPHQPIYEQSNLEISFKVSWALKFALFVLLPPTTLLVSDHMAWSTTTSSLSRLHQLQVWISLQAKMHTPRSSAPLQLSASCFCRSVHFNTQALPEDPWCLHQSPANALLIYILLMPSTPHQLVYSLTKMLILSTLYDHKSSTSEVPGHPAWTLVWIVLQSFPSFE